MYKHSLSRSAFLMAGLALFVAQASCKPPKPAVSKEDSAPAQATPGQAPTAEEKADAPKTSAKPVELPEVVATVNGQNITRGQLQEIFNAALEASGAKISDLSPEQQLGGYNQLLKDLITDKLISEAAAGEKVSPADVDAEVAKIKGQFPNAKAFEEQMKQSGMSVDKLKERIRTGMQQSRWMQSQIKTEDISEAKAKAFYESNIKEFEQPETVKASHILFRVDQDAKPETASEKEKAANAAAKRAKAGEDFSKLAKELSEEPGASESGGDLGFFSKDRMVPEFAEAAFTQKVGEIGKPVKTQFGWHVIKVTDKKPAGTVPFDEVKDQITAYLKSANQREAVQGVIKKLQDSANIETFLPKQG